MSSLQEQLERIYCPPLDTALVAAIASDEGQTFQSAKEVLDSLVADIEPESAAAGVGSSSQASSSISRSASPSPSVGSSEDGTQTPATSEDIDRMLDEFHLAEKLDAADRMSSEAGAGGAKEAHLRLTDDEGSEVGDAEDVGDAQKGKSRKRASSSKRRAFPAYDENKEQQADPKQRLQTLSTGAETDPVEFLNHAFPTRTEAFLRDTLKDCGGDVGGTIDTLMAIDVAEREAVNEAAALSSPPSPMTSAKKGLDFEALSSSSSNAKTKGKRGRAMRKQAQQEYLRSVGEDTGPIKGAKTKVTLGDIRQGGGARQSVKRQKSTSPTPPSPAVSGTAGLSDFELARRLAKEEDPNAGEAVRDNQWLLTSSVLSQMSTLLEIDSMTVTSTYNKSSFNLHVAVGRLIDSSANAYPSLQSLEAAGGAPQGTARSLVDSLSSLSGKSTDMTALCLRATKGRQDATLDLLTLLDVVKEATLSEVPDELDPLGKLKGDLGEDVGDKKNREAESSQKGVSVDVGSSSYPLPGESTRLDPRAMHQAQRGGKFAKAAIAGHQSANAHPTGQAKALATLMDGRESSAAPSRGAISFPPSSSAEGLPIATQLMFAGNNSGSAAGSSSLSSGTMAAPRTLREKEEAINYYRSIAAEYQQRRNDCLSQASSAWRTSANRNKSAAFYYADEARRLDLKSRAFNLKASQALVEFRKANRGEASYTPLGGGGSGSSSRGAGVVDLHGVTVREALAIVQDELNQWWSLPSSSAKKSLTVITGAGKHSPNQVAILTPSVAKFLQREGWKADVDKSRGVIVVRGR